MMMSYERPAVPFRVFVLFIICGIILSTTTPVSCSISSSSELSSGCITDTYSIPYEMFASRIVVNKDQDLQYKVKIVKKDIVSSARSNLIDSSTLVELKITYDTAGLSGVGSVGYSFNDTLGSIVLEIKSNSNSNNSDIINPYNSTIVNSTQVVGNDSSINNSTTNNNNNSTTTTTPQTSTSTKPTKPSVTMLQPKKSIIVSCASTNKGFVEGVISKLVKNGRFLLYSSVAVLMLVFFHSNNHITQTRNGLIFSVIVLGIAFIALGGQLSHAVTDQVSEMKADLSCAIPTITITVPSSFEIDLRQEDPSLSPEFNWNEMNGQTFYEDDVLFAGFSGTSFEGRTLMRFSDLQGRLPVGSFITSASLDLTYIAWVKGCKIRVNYLNNTWIVAKKTGWRFRNYNQKLEWNTAGGDVLSNSYSVMETGMSDDGNQIKSIALDPNIVQSWFDDNTKNNGLMISEVAGTTIKPTIFGGNSTISFRPRLTVTYQMQPTKPPQYPMVLGLLPLRIFVQSKTFNCSQIDCGDDDTGSGTISAPFRSLAKALTFAQPNDIILLREGIHAGNVQITRRNITIQSYSNEKAIIASPVNDPAIAIALYFRRDSSYSTLRNVELVGGFDYAIRIESSIDWGGNNLKYGASNVVIENCKIHSSGYHLIKIDSLCENTIIRNNELFDAGKRVKTGGSAIVCYDTFMTKIQDNYIHYTMGAAIMIKSGARNSIIERNYINKIYGAGILVGFYETGEYFSDPSQNPLYYQAVNTIVRNNILNDISGAGIGLYSAKNTLIMFNTIWKAAKDNQAGILINVVQTWVSNSYSPIIPCTNVTIMNNIIGSATERVIEIRTLTSYVDDSVVGGLEGNMNVSYNIYYSMKNANGANGLFSDQRNTIGYVGGFAGWKTKYQDYGSVEGNPLIDPIAYYPSSTSFAIGKGLYTPTIISDYFGRPMKPKSITIGALQFLNDGFEDDPTMKYSITNIIYNPSFNGTVPPKDILPTWAPPTTYRTIYVSNSGNDNSGNGTITNPFKTIQKVTDSSFAKDNDIVIVRGGIYQEGAIRISSTNYTIKSYENENVKIISDVNNANILWGIKTFSKFVTIEGLEIVGSFYYGLMIDSTDVTIRNVKIHDTGSDCIKLSPFTKRVSILHSEIYQCGKRKTYQAGDPNQGSASGDAIRCVNVDDLFISRNYIHDITGTAIKTQGGGLRAVIERNLILNIGGLGITLGFYEETSYMDPTQNPYYYEAIDGLVKNNIIVNVQGSGVGLYASKNSRVYHNTIVSAALSMQVPILLAASPHTINSVEIAGQSNHNPTIKNNIVQVSESGITQTIYEIRVQDGDALDNSKLDSNSNIYYSNFNNYHGNSMANINFMDRRLSSYLFTSDFDLWRAHIQSDYNSSIIDPILDFNLKIESDSPARNVAPLLDEVTEDFYGNPRSGNNNDIGALLFTTDMSNSSYYPPAVGSLLLKSGKNLCSGNMSSFEMPCTIYVSNIDGNDADCLGTFEKPFKTIQQALAVAAPFSNITIRYTGVSYNESLSIKTPHLRISTFDNDPYEALILSSVYSPSILHTLRFESTAFGCSVSRLHLQGGYFYTLKVDADNIQVDNSIIHYCGTKCVFALNANNFSLTNSEVYDSGMRDPSDGEGIHAVISHSFECKDNYVHDITADAIKLEGGSSNAVISGNAIANADRGILIGGRIDNLDLFEESNNQLFEATNSSVYNNIISNTFGVGIAMYGSKQCGIYFNTIINTCITNTQGASIHLASTKHRNLVVSPVDTPIIVNNIVYNGDPNNAGVMFRLDEGLEGSASITGSIIMNNNLYYSNKSTVFVDGRKATKFSGNFNLWKTQISTMFGNGNEANSLSVAPQLDTDNLSPKSSSPAISSAYTSLTQSITSDFYGNIRNLSDIGAIISNAQIVSKSKPRTIPFNISKISLSKSSNIVRYPPSGIQSTWFVPGYTSVDDPSMFDLSNCSIYPSDNPWNQDISTLPVHPRSDAFINNVPKKFLHADFGTTYDGALNGIPYVIVTKDQEKVGITLTSYASESDPGPYPFPEGSPIEGGPNSNGDRHIIVLDKDTCKLYETWRTFPILKQYRESEGGNYFTAECGAVFDLKSNKLRPLGYTSSDAAGLPVYPGLVKYDEIVVKKQLSHAVRFTVMTSQKAYILPATHFASANTNPNIMPMGLRLRMKATYDCSLLSEEIQVICSGLKKYGMILADNGGDFYISGAPHPLWDDNHLNDMKKIPTSAFEVVYTGKTCIDPTCNTWRDEITNN